MTDIFTDDAVLSRSPDVLFRRVLDGVVVRAPKMTESLHLSMVGYLVWVLLAESITVRDLVSSLADFNEIPPQTIRDDITPLLKDLHVAGALSVASACH